MRNLLGSIAALALLFGLALPVAAADKLTICHATSSEANPFVAIKVDADAGFSPHLSDNEGNSPLAGHEQDFLLENTDLQTCDQVADTVSPLAPSITDATCDSAGMLTIPAVEGITYSIDPAYTAGDSGEFVVTATADEGFVIADGAETEFTVSVPAALECSENTAALAPSVSAPTCTASGSLTINAAAGVTYSVTPAYTVGASGSFTVSAVAADGFVLVGQSSFTVNVAPKKVCHQGTEAGNPPTPKPLGHPALGASTGGVPNTAMEGPSPKQEPILISIIAIAGLGYLGRRNLVATSSRR